MLTYLCHMDLLSPVFIFHVFLNEAFVCSNIPIVFACFVVACCRVILRTSVTSLITWDMNTDPLSDMIVVGKYGCLVMMLNMSFAIVFASWLEVG